MPNAVDVDWTSAPDTSADPVCAFYTRHPYPPPVDNLDRARDEWQDAYRHRALHQGSADLGVVLAF